MSDIECHQLNPVFPCSTANLSDGMLNSVTLKVNFNKILFMVRHAANTIDL